MSVHYHGLIIDSPNSGQLRFGVERLIGSCLTWIFRLQEDLPENVREALTRFDNKAYWQCAAKTRDTVFKMDRAVSNLGQCMDILEREREYVFDGAPIEKAAIYYKAAYDLSYHFDSLLAYLRILADCISFALPFFYRNVKGIANRSFREHLNWFVNKSPDFDPEYTAVLNANCDWFEKLAGKNPKGVRDLAFHNFATYQLGTNSDANGNRRIVVYQVTSTGLREPDLCFTVAEIIVEFFIYLDCVYELFGNRIAKELAPVISGSLEKQSHFITFSRLDDLQQKYSLYPLIEGTDSEL